MGRLKAYSEPTVSVEVKSASGTMPLVCYGLNEINLLALVRDYGGVLAPLYEKAVAGQMDDNNAMQVIVDLMENVPALVATTLFLGLRGEDDEDMDVIVSLPVGAKIELLEAILKLTFHSEGGAGKLFEIVKREVLGRMKAASQHET